MSATTSSNSETSGPNMENEVKIQRPRMQMRSADAAETMLVAATRFGGTAPRPPAPRYEICAQMRPTVAVVMKLLRNHTSAIVRGWPCLENQVRRYLGKGEGES